MTIKKKNNRKKKVAIVLGIILAIVIALVVGANFYINSLLNNLERTETIDGEDVYANELDGNVVNIALFGIDSDDGYVGRSDVVKIISLNYDTDEITITSVQRDVLFYLPLESMYDKLNHSYAYGGAAGAIASLNYCLDLNITEYVSFNFDSMPTIIDMLGGVSITITDAEASSLGLSGAGTYLLTGDQALSYSRIRNIDNDYVRMERQTNVINAILSSMSSMSSTTIVDTVTSVLPLVETNITNSAIKSYALNALSFNLGDIDSYSFPSEGGTSVLATINIYNTGSQSVLKDFVAEVEALHNFIYASNYAASSNVEQVDADGKAYAGY